jgi:FixJ family two-component response regulator
MTNINRKSIAAAGICELLEKPVSFPALAAAVHRALTKAKELPVAAEDRGPGTGRREGVRP